VPLPNGALLQPALMSDEGREVVKQEIEIRRDLTKLSEVRTFVRQFCACLPGARLDQDDVGALELAVTEAASNIMRHAYHGNEEGSIRVEAESLPGKIRLRLLHQGASFDPSTAALPVLDCSAESGYGVFIIAQSVDDVRYYRDDLGTNCIELTKTVKSPGGEREH